MNDTNDIPPQTERSGSDMWLTLHAMSGIFRMATQLITMMVLVPIVIHYVGEERYGVWTLAMAISGALMFMELGLVQSANRHLASLDYRKDPELMQAMSCTAFWMTSIAAVAVLLVGLMFSYEIGALFDMPENVRREAGIIVTIFVWRMALSIPLRVFNAVLLSQRLMARAHFSQGLTSLLYFAIGLMVLDAGYGLNGLAVAYLGTMILEHLAYVLMSLKVVPLNAYWPGRIRKIHMIKLAEFALFAWIGQIVNVIFQRAGVMIVQLTGGLIATGAFGVTIRLTSISAELSAQVIAAGGPKVAKLAAASEEGRREAGWLTLTLARRSMLLSAPLAAVAIPLGYYFMTGWIGAEMAGFATLPLAILATTSMLNSPMHTASNTLALTGDHRFTNLASLGIVAFYIPLAYLFGDLWGTAGVALTSLLLHGIVMAPIMIRRVTRKLGIIPGRWVTLVYLPHLLPLLVSMLAGYGLAELIELTIPAGRMWIAATVAAGLLCVGLYLVIFFTFTAPPEERARFRQALASFKKRLGLNSAKD